MKATKNITAPAETLSDGKTGAAEPIKHISEIMETCRLHDEDTGEETDEYKYYEWLTYAHRDSYHPIADKALAEALAWIFIAAYRKGKGHIMAMNQDRVLIETVITSTPTETPRISPENVQTANVSPEQGNGDREAENEPKREFAAASNQVER